MFLSFFVRARSVICIRIPQQERFCINSFDPMNNLICIRQHSTVPTAHIHVVTKRERNIKTTEKKFCRLFYGFHQSQAETLILHIKRWNECSLRARCECEGENVRNINHQVEMCVWSFMLHSAAATTSNISRAHIFFISSVELHTRLSIRSARIRLFIRSPVVESEKNLHDAADKPNG